MCTTVRVEYTTSMIVQVLIEYNSTVRVQVHNAYDSRQFTVYNIIHWLLNPTKNKINYIEA